MDTYQSLGPKHLPPLLRQRDLRDTNLPAPMVPIHGDAQRPAHDLVAETHAHDLDPPVGGQRLLREPHQLDDPRVVQVRGVLGPGDQDGVDVVEAGVRRVRVVDDVVGGDGQGRRHGLRGGGAAEEVGEDAAVGLEPGGRAGEGRVGLEDGEADGGWRGHLCNRGGGGRERGGVRVEVARQRDGGGDGGCSRENIKDGLLSLFLSLDARFISSFPDS